MENHRILCMCLEHVRLSLRTEESVCAELHGPVLMLHRLVDGHGAPSGRMIDVTDSGAMGTKCPQSKLCFLKSDGRLTVIVMKFWRCFSWNRCRRLRPKLYTVLASERPQSCDSIPYGFGDTPVVTSKWASNYVLHYRCGFLEGRQIVDLYVSK
jgi:hypothetical protein